LNFEDIKLIKDEPIKEILNVDENELPYPSLNEVNYLAFGESDDEYHNELYGYIESEEKLPDYKNGKVQIPYKKLKGAVLVDTQIILSEYIRHQIHHPENTHNVRYTNEQLQESIGHMRVFVQTLVR
jgi:hypothetical protein